MTTKTAKAGDAVLAATIAREVAKRVVAQELMVERLLVGLLTGGHILLEGVPGLAKTLAVRTVAECLRIAFSRIQFTPDLLPADVIGTMVFDQKTQEFYPKKGPLFANLVLADEINRAPAKVQAALLEAMQEKQVTLGGETFFLGEPFLVLATQNPIEQEGTYPLPEAQLDRFMLKVRVGYPTRDAEKEIVARMASGRWACRELRRQGPWTSRWLPGPRPPASRHSRSAPAGQGHRAPHAFPGQLAVHGRIPLDVPWPGHRIRRGTRVPAGRRLPRDRLERVGAYGPPVREDVPRGAREHAAPRGGPVRLVPVRASLHEGRPRGGGRGRAGTGGGAPQRPRGRPDVRGPGRVDRATRQGPAARSARDPRSRGVHTARPGHQPGRGAELRGEAAEAPCDRGRAIGLPGRGLGGSAGAAGGAPRCRRHHHRRPARTPAPRRGLGGYGGRRDRSAGPARYQPRADADACERCRRAPAPGAHPEACPSGCGPRRAPDQRAVRRAAAPRLRRACPPAEKMTVRLVCLGIVASWRLATGQGGGWSVTPAAPTVGDTIRLERAFPLRDGWQVRAGKLDATDAVEPLADAAVLRSADGWVVRYVVVAWKPGVHKLALPPLWLLGPDGRADSTAGGTTTFRVASVIPDSLRSPSPEGSLAPLRAAHPAPEPPPAAVAQ